jgi:ribose/xylose/arabinose/galactoside ABC-type transport system permease subunit
MANMTEQQRAQYDRAELRVPSTGVQVRNRRPLVIYTVLALIMLGVLGTAAIAGIDTWWQGVVFGVIILTTVGAMIALSPSRRG